MKVKTKATQIMNAIYIDNVDWIELYRRLLYNPNIFVRIELDTRSPENDKFFIWNDNYWREVESDSWIVHSDDFSVVYVVPDSIFVDNWEEA
jgi:hypothetical protein